MEITKKKVVYINGKRVEETVENKVVKNGREIVNKKVVKGNDITNFNQKHVRSKEELVMLRRQRNERMKL